MDDAAREGRGEDWSSRGWCVPAEVPKCRCWPAESESQGGCQSLKSKTPAWGSAWSASFVCTVWEGLGDGPLCRKPNSKILPPYRRAVLLKPVVGKGQLLTMLGVKWTKIEIKNVSGHFATFKRMVLYLEERWIFYLWNIMNCLLLRTQVSMPAVNSFMSEVKCFTFYRRGQKQDGCHTTVLCRWWKYTVLCSEANSYW